LVTGCASHQIKNVYFYREIPFADAPEAVKIGTIEGEELLTAEEYASKRPYMLMIDPEGVKTIQEMWYETCRSWGQDCNVQLKSVEDTVRKLDDLASKVLKGVF
jgi:hypothetical protein